VREHGLSDATFYAWNSKYTGASVAELTRLKHLEEENRCLKQMSADLSLKNQTIHGLGGGCTLGEVQLLCN
jgi:putative transposase